MWRDLCRSELGPEIMHANSHANMVAFMIDIVYDRGRGVMNMPNIKPISDLRNYSDVLKDVDTYHRVYLTRNGHGEYGILTMEEIDKLDRYRAAYQLFIRLKNAMKSADKESGISINELEKMLDMEAGEGNAASSRQHRSLEERAGDFGGKLGPYEEFDWGEPVGRERW